MTEIPTPDTILVQPFKVIQPLDSSCSIDTTKKKIIVIILPFDKATVELRGDLARNEFVYSFDWNRNSHRNDSIVENSVHPETYSTFFTIQPVCNKTKLSVNLNWRNP